MPEASALFESEPAGQTGNETQWQLGHATALNDALPLNLLRVAVQ